MRKLVSGLATLVAGLALGSPSATSHLVSATAPTLQIQRGYGIVSTNPPEVQVTYGVYTTSGTISGGILSAVDYQLGKDGTGNNCSTQISGGQSGQSASCVFDLSSWGTWTVTASYGSIQTSRTFDFANNKNPNGSK